MEEVDQKEAVAAGRLGTHRDVLREYWKDGRAESQRAEREQPKTGRPGPSVVASPEQNRTLRSWNAQSADEMNAFQRLRPQQK